MSDLIQQPRSRALFGGGPWPTNGHGAGAFVFEGADDCLSFMFGGPQHDAHVRKWRQHARLIEDLAEYDARYRAVQQHVNAMIARERAL